MTSSIPTSSTSSNIVSPSTDDKNHPTTQMVIEQTTNLFTPKSISESHLATIIVDTNDEDSFIRSSRNGLKRSSSIQTGIMKLAHSVVSPIVKLDGRLTKSVSLPKRSKSLSRLDSSTYNHDTFEPASYPVVFDVHFELFSSKHRSELLKLFSRYEIKKFKKEVSLHGYDAVKANARATFTEKNVTVEKYDQSL
eukprot:Awhi_evm1s12468